MNILLGNQGNKIEVISEINTLQKYKFEVNRKTIKCDDEIYQEYIISVYLYTPWCVKIFESVYATTIYYPNNYYHYQFNSKRSTYFNGDTLYLDHDEHLRLKLNYDCKNELRQSEDKAHGMVMRDIAISRRFVDDVKIIQDGWN